MKRKTNLFYNADSNDSKFITFSNYAESLTGNFLSTDTKLFPSCFLCCDVPSLRNVQSKDEYNDVKSEFIKSYLVARYENKLAYLRDYYAANNLNPEDTLTPLKYLWESIIDFDAYTSIKFVDNITEQDYNGTFTDTICVVDTTNYSYGEWVTNEDRYSYVEYNESLSYLYGWVDNIADEEIIEESINEIYIGPSEYSYVSPRLDDNNEGVTSNNYNINSKLSYIQLYKTSKDVNELSFNILIPLYDVYNTKYVEKSDYNELTAVNDEIDSLYIKNVPLGIWFAGNNTIILKRDDMYAPSWTLAIGSQFKPFPMTKNMPSEMTQNARKEAYGTFAQVLSRQNNIIDMFNNLEVQLATLTHRIENIESQLSHVGTTANIDDVKKDVANMKIYMNEQLNEMRQIVDERKKYQWVEKNI